MIAALPSLLVTYVVNALWQIPILYLAALLAAPLLRRIGSESEHRLWVSTLSFATILPACHFALSLPLWHHGRATPGGNVRVTFTAQTSAQSGILHLPKAILLALTTIYLLALAYFAARLAWSLCKTSQLQRQSQPIQLPVHLQSLWASHTQSFNTHLAISTEVSGPVVLGLRTHWLLLPPNFLTQVDPQDLEAALAHEFAHIQRRDFALNLLYEFLALPIALHPITHLLRARIAETREIVCDTVAARTTQGEHRYAHSLLRLAALVPAERHAQSVHAIGIFDANTLERRITVMTTPRITLTPTRRIASLAACLVLACATCASALALSLNVDGRDVPQAKPLSVAIGKTVILHRESPVYPPEAKANNDTVNGTCTLHLVIDETGTPVNITILKSLRRDYDISALEAVKQWRWQPYLLNGKPTAVDTTVQVTYSYNP